MGARLGGAADGVPLAAQWALVVALPVVALLALRRRARAARPECYTLPNNKRIHHLRKAETDFLFGEIFRGGGYLQAASPSGADGDAARLTLRPGDTVVDVGANIGMFALFCAWSAETSGEVTVLSYEPVPSTHAVLEANAALHSDGERTVLEAYAFGLSDAASTTTIHHHPNFSIWSTVDAGSAPPPAARRSPDPTPPDPTPPTPPTPRRAAHAQWTARATRCCARTWRTRRAPRWPGCRGCCAGSCRASL